MKSLGVYRAYVGIEEVGRCVNAHYEPLENIWIRLLNAHNSGTLDADHWNALQMQVLQLHCRTKVEECRKLGDITTQMSHPVDL